MKTYRNFVAALAVLTLTAAGCATGHGRQIGWGMVGGAAVGALAGNQLIKHGNNSRQATQDTAVTAVIAALATGAVLNWHYQALQDKEVELSGRYARARICAGGLGGACEDAPVVTPAAPADGRSALNLDDGTKWAIPGFRKRMLPPEPSETQVLSTRYIWEIIRPGRFVTRTQNPEYFVESSATTRERPR